ncbi:urease accessory protein [Gemmobacter megaterium]|uniref:Urease accessory protein UreD n=1 Tax=Gemmobacter megaterium TaxID=1086013 RepID=A0A1N7P741_9RHOB|nr:urease accessory protein UreD [Gemmobacter megaterium]GGE20181.1 urease accessory protein UreD [Gemmobacter megaterium]SIT06269.1 urease accessory protein [Gemmobacter megaterium]
MTALATLPLPRHQRSHGEIAASWRMSCGHSRLHRLRQAGSARAIPLPGPDLVVLNTSGGLTGGDRLAIALDVGEGCRVTATTQTAERFYRATEGRAQIDIAMTVGAGAHLDWLPQETILFQGCAADRRTTIDLGPQAGCLMLETLVMGRAAMGETLSQVSLRDWRQIRRAGRPVHLDPLALDAARIAPRAAGLAGARAICTLVMVSHGAEDAIGPVRTVLNHPEVSAAASAWDGRLVVRLMAPDAWPLRRQVIRLLTVLRRSPLPRVWQS